MLFMGEKSVNAAVINYLLQQSMCKMCNLNLELVMVTTRFWSVKLGMLLMSVDGVTFRTLDR
jgi:hypothetical protein